MKIAKSKFKTRIFKNFEKRVRYLLYKLHTRRLVIVNLAIEFIISE